MKIGIITLSASDNCGSLLQSYALKRLLSLYGKVEIINFSSLKSHLLYDIFPKGFGKKAVLRKLPYFIKLKREKKGYKKFRADKLEISGREYFAHELCEVAEKYDIVVTGSDQVWNVRMADFDEAFFLGWTSCKKVAYAPSLGGIDIAQSPNLKKIKDWINDIQYLSVREEGGKTCLEKTTGRSVEKVLDPTLAVDEGIWYALSKQRLVDGEYIFFYSWAYCDESTLKIVADEAERLKVPVYVIDARKWQGRNPSKWRFTLYKDSGPEIFLSLMRYAKRCYVESFHGMVFAYIFKKDFWLLDAERSLSELDSRLKEFVDLLGMEERVLTQYNVDKKKQDERISYLENFYLKEMKEKSLKFLDNALKEQ